MGVTWELPDGAEVVLRDRRAPPGARGVLFRRVGYEWLPVFTCAPPPECAYCFRFITEPRRKCDSNPHLKTCKHWSEL